MAIDVQHLGKTFRDYNRNLVVIDDLSIRFESGKSYAVVGRSGIGKSTLLYLLGGLDRPSHGSISYDGVSLEGLTEEARAEVRGKKVGFVFQFHHLLPEFTALENVALPLLIAGGDEAEAHRRAAEALEAVGLGDRVSHRPAELSGGELQRAAVARALIHKPTVVLADEPTGNLDATSAGVVQRLLIDLHRAMGNTLIVVTHSLELAASMDTVLEMEPGGILREIRPSKPEET